MKSNLWQELKPNEISVERLFGCSVEALSRFRLSKIYSLKTSTHASSWFMRCADLGHTGQEKIFG